MAWGGGRSSSTGNSAPEKAAPFHSAPAPRGLIDATTVTSLLALLSLLVGAYGLSLRFLPKSASTKTRILFIWHLFAALVHMFFEGSFLYNCFFVSYSLPTSFSATNRNHPHIHIFTPPDVYWLGVQDKLYGANYGTGPFSKLWQEYARADKRWGGVELSVVTLEILTVALSTPLSLWICYLLTKEERKGALKRWFWMIILATCDLYGGWMTFGPEWLTGSPNLDTSNWMYLWLYLTLFNGLWVVFPLWILYEAYRAMNSAISQAEMVDLVHYLKKGE